MEYENKVSVLSELFTSYKNNTEWSDFFDYNDIGLPLAFMVSEKIVQVDEIGIRYIEETYTLLCETLGLSEEDDFDSLQDMINSKQDWEEVAEDEQ